MFTVILPLPMVSREKVGGPVMYVERLDVKVLNSYL